MRGYEREVIMSLKTSQVRSIDTNTQISYACAIPCLSRKSVSHSIVVLHVALNFNKSDLLWWMHVHPLRRGTRCRWWGQACLRMRCRIACFPNFKKFNFQKLKFWFFQKLKRWFFHRIQLDFRELFLCDAARSARVWPTAAAREVSRPRTKPESAYQTLLDSENLKNTKL